MSNSYPNVINVSASLPTQEQVFYGTASPPDGSGSYTAGDTYYVTPLGTKEDADNATEEWRFDGEQWVMTPVGSAPLDVLSTVQPTPTASGNTTNLNTIFKDANGDTWAVDKNGDAIKVSSAPVAAPQHETEVQLATAAQTEFTLAYTPIGKVIVTRNGVDVTSSFSFVGAVGTYIPADNYDCVFDADDKVQFHYEKAA